MVILRQKEYANRLPVSEEDLKKLKINISNADWFRFAQEKEYAK